MHDTIYRYSSKYRGIDIFDISVHIGVSIPDTAILNLTIIVLNPKMDGKYVVFGNYVSYILYIVK